MATENEEQPKNRVTRTFEWIRQYPFGFIGILLLIALVTLIVIWAILADTSPQWTGFGAYDEEVSGPRAKTLWDWMDLLLIPLILAIAGYWFSHTQKQAELEIAEKERETDREIAYERQQQQTLENYLDRMKELLLDRNLGPEATAEVKRLARTWTLNVLRELTAKRNKQVIQFLQESRLLGKEPIVDLARTDLNGADLRGTNLYRARLNETQLRGTQLREAYLDEASLKSAKLNKADLKGASLSKANLNRADLSETNLSGAYLFEANLLNANLSEANLSGANLRSAYLIEANESLLGLPHRSRANLTGADLRNTNLIDAFISKEQLSQTKLSNATIMPDGSTYYEWKQKQDHDQE